MERIIRYIRTSWSFDPFSFLMLSFCFGIFTTAVVFLAYPLLDIGPIEVGDKTQGTYIFKTLPDKISKDFLAVFCSAMATILGITISLVPTIVSSFLNKYGYDEIRGTFLREPAYKKLKHLFVLWLVLAFIIFILFDFFGVGLKMVFSVFFLGGFVWLIFGFYRFIGTLENYVKKADETVSQALLNDIREFLNQNE